MNFSKVILITGGAGFIGTHLVKHWVRTYTNQLVINVDLLTYAGNLENLRDIENSENYKFIKGDIRDADFLAQLFIDYPIDSVIHLAAESHVDRSITDPQSFLETNILGTFQLLNACKNAWKDQTSGKLFYHVSTDEVFGSLGEEGYFTEETAYDPRSPYSASKAASDHLVRAYFHTYHLPVVISNCSNNYGPYQFPEKLIPLMIRNIIGMKNLPVYGDGKNTRDWLWVGDHVSAIDLIFHRGEKGETYAIGGHNEWQNLALVQFLCQSIDKKLGKEEGTSEKLITFVTDRKGHDRRYAIDATKLKDKLGWEPQISPEEGMVKTVDWYVENAEWLDSVTSGNYQEYYKKQYQD
ncbi:MAG: dTDP-glucose 4,6-dehydratase [Saprospiraceae bacterium]|nr:dTDP-glucose 4,6-dehydratase [Saprospiraceae bacterium]MDP4700820.1 dTDP-glucose 4,6-dehydratase [Saprospiraceae bacterium]MDP4816053.1 dTDP-glucose 4,6-dehydratase [Saprospiraceae bacterium]